MADLTLHQGVRETIDMAAGCPDPRVHHDRGVQTYHIIPTLDYRLPPGIFNIALKLHPHRAIIPAARQTTIYFAAGENESPSLTQRNDFIHIHFIRHHQISFEFIIVNRKNLYNPPSPGRKGVRGRGNTPSP